MPRHLLRIDLHCHTTASDGTLSPEELVARARRDRVDVIAVTDHDTIDAIAEATAAGVGAGVSVVPGIELSSVHQGRNVHMLGYFVDTGSEALRAALAAIIRARVERANEIVEKLCALGYEVGIDEVLAQAVGDVVARPHIARALVARGYIGAVRDAFTAELMADGGAADVTKRTLSAHEAIALIRSAGGAPVIAHPAVGHHEGAARGVPVELLADLRDAGMVGLEAEHPDHPPLVRDELHRVARGLGLIATGGSDFHGDVGHVIGNCTTSAETLDRLERAAQRPD